LPRNTIFYFLDIDLKKFVLYPYNISGGKVGRAVFLVPKCILSKSVKFVRINKYTRARTRACIHREYAFLLF